MRKRLLKTAPAIFLIIGLIAAFGFSTGLYGEEDIIVPVDIPTLKYECNVCWSYVYDPTAEGAMSYEDLLLNGWICPTGGCTGTESNLVVEVTACWVCPYCGYVYDPSVAGVAPFEKLLDGWTCPVCSSLKSDFVEDTVYGEYISSDPWIVHLQHVLAMRSKHLAVLQRVIEAHESKDIEHSSLSGLWNAYVSSSKSVLKAKAAIAEYLGYLDSAENTGDDELIFNSEDNKDHNVNGKENNNGNKDKKENKEHSNNGKAKGKNK